MRLDISSKNLVRLEVDGLTLRCHDNNGNITFHSLEGITELYCYNNQLQSLPALPNGLKWLACENNRLSSLPTLPGGLKVLQCYGNQLQSLPALPNGLKELSCSRNQLLTLSKQPSLPNSLKWLYCSDNQLQSLSNLPLNSLKGLFCYNNPLIFIRPIPKRPRYYRVPKNLEHLHSPIHYDRYCSKYQTYVYLITHLTLQLNVSPVILSNEHFWFPGISN